MLLIALLALTALAKPDDLEALGWKDGAAAEIRDKLAATEPVVSGPRARPQWDDRRALMWAQGRQGESEDVAGLVEALDYPPAYAVIAAEALGRMGRREVEGARGAVPALTAKLGHLDKEVGQAAAFALYRIGLDDADDEAVAAVAAALPAAKAAPARAWIIKAAWDKGDKAALFAAGVHDHDQLVRASALQAVTEGDLPVSAVAPLLKDDKPHVRLAAVRALGRLGGEEAMAALEPLTDGDDPSVDAVSAWLSAGGEADPALPLDEDAPLAVRVAHAAAVTDPQTLVDISRKANEARVRTAAAGTLLGVEDIPAELSAQLLLATDEGVREAALEILGRGELDDSAVLGLLQQIRVENAAEVLVGAMDLSATQLSAEGRTPTADHVEAARRALPRLLKHDAPRVRASAAALATLLALPDEPGNDAEPELLLEKALRIRSARVFTEKGEFRIDLYPDVAPMAVQNFAQLAWDGYFDDLIFHRVVPGFVVQGGCPRGDGWGGPGYTIPDEYSSVRYDKGAVGMARAAPDTGGSQWFVTLTDQPHLVGDYTLFGSVGQGMHVVRSLEPDDRIVAVVIERIGED